MFFLASTSFVSTVFKVGLKLQISVLFVGQKRNLFGIMEKNFLFSPERIKVQKIILTLLMIRKRSKSMNKDKTLLNRKKWIIPATTVRIHRKEILF